MLDAHSAVARQGRRSRPLFAVLLSLCLSVQASAQEVEVLLAEGPGEGDNFARAVAIDGDTAVVGAVFASSSALNTGRAFVFTRDGTGRWSESVELLRDDAETADHFGFSVAIQGDTIFVGATLDASEIFPPFGSQAGSVYVYKRDAEGVWNLAQLLRPDDEFESLQFGSAIDVDGDLLVVGARWTPVNNLTAHGVAHVFRKQGDLWVHESQLRALDGAEADRFGSTVAVSGNTIAVGALSHDHSLLFNKNFGAVYLFEPGETPGSWEQKAELFASDAAQSDNFGYDVALEGDRLLIGAPMADSGDLDTGAAYLFEREDGVWTEVEKLLALDAGDRDRFGNSVALVGDQALVGANREDARAAAGGAVYLLRLPELAPTTQAKYAPRDLEDADWFGYSVAFDGESVIVGAPLSDSVAPSDGAAYVVALSELAPWTDLGQGLAGEPGVPNLTAVGSLVERDPGFLALGEALPEAAAWLVAGFATAAVPLKGGVLLPAPELLFPLALDADGRALLPIQWPSGLPVGGELLLQVWVIDAAAPFGVAASNGLRAELP